MKKLAFVLTAIVITSMSFSSVSRAESLVSMTDKFYNALTEIIERNISNPKNCVQKVNSFYKKNKVLIARIRSETEKAMKEMAPLIEKYKNLSNGQMSQAELDKLQAQMPKGQGSFQDVSDASQRYGKALQSFTEKHPMDAAKIAMKAMELLPDTAMGVY
tara:strand:+ start:3124 stop:3603 length:480 start_codon:yes stop_codon:yes gene_type:complete